MACFYQYTLRQTRENDLALAAAWTGTQNILPSVDEIRADIQKARFWIDAWRGCENTLVFEDDEPLAFFQIRHVGKGDQVRIAFQASPVSSPKKILRGITKLVPLIEQALSLRGVRAIFFTSHSLAMVAFMEKRLGYRLQMNVDGGADGVVMAKELK